MYRLDRFKKIRPLIALSLIIVLFFSSFGGLLPVHTTQAADVSIDATVSTTGIRHNNTDSNIVFTSGTTGYVFYVDSTGACVYSKTTNSGSTWGAAVTVDAQTDCLGIAVWYDQWTPGDTTGTFIHTVTFDTSADHLWYTRLNTSGDVLTTTVDISTSSGQTGTFAAANTPTITKATNGTLYTAVTDNSDSYMLKCSTTCTTGTNWTEAGTTPFANKPADEINLMPVSGGNIMAIRRDVSAETIDSQIYTDGTNTWAGSWTSIATVITDNTAYKAAWGATVDTKTNNIYLAYTADIATPGTDDDIRTALYNGTSWSAGTNVITNDAKGITGAKIARDENTGDIYVVYSGRTTPGTAATGNVYWKRSTDNMSTWSTETGPINTTAANLFGTRINITFTSRLYVDWATVAGALRGNTIITSDQARQRTIDSTVTTTSAIHNGSGATTVFTSSLIGYAFYTDSGGTCVYSKTSDAGRTWGAAVTVDSQTDCIGLAVWYDRWTPGDTTGNFIHIVTADSGSSDLWYTRLDTSTDTLSTTIVVSSAPGSVQGGTLVAGANLPSITKATDGQLYVSIHDDADVFMLQCSTTCTSGANWTESGTNPWALAANHVILMPLASGDVMVMRWNVAANAVQSRTYTTATSTWGSQVSIDASAIANTTYTGTWGAVVNKTTNNIYLAYGADMATPGTDDDIRTAEYNGSIWTARTNVLTNDTKGLTGVKIARDESSGTLYVVYSARSTAGTATTGDVYWKSSVDGMVSWGTEQGPINLGSDDIYGARINSMSPQRLYVTWNGATPDSLFGNSIVGGYLNMDIVDASGHSIVNPSVAMTNGSVSLVFQTRTGTLGVSAQKLRIANMTGNPLWTASIAATNGVTSFWDGVSSDYDFNDPTANAGDGADADSLGGRMTVNPSVGTLSPAAGCANTGLTLGSSSGFSQGVTDSITLVSTGLTAATNCYWDLTGVSLSQTIPVAQGADNYSISMTLSIIAN